MNIFAATRLNSVVQFITLLIVFIFVLALTYFTTRFIGSYQKNLGVNSNFKVIDGYRISNTKYIQIIQVGKKYLVIAVSKDNVELLTELTEDEIFFREVSEDAKEPFEKIFEKVKSKTKKLKENSSVIKDKMRKKQ